MKSSNKSRKNLSKYNSTKTIFIGLVIFFIFSTLFMVMIFTRQITNLNQRVDNISFELKMVKSQLDSKISLSQPSLIADSNTLAFPEFKIAVPYSNTSSTLLYDYNNEDNTIRVTSKLVGEDPTMAQLSCQELVMLSTSNGNAYSPWQKSVGEVKLADGRTLYIIKSVAYENNEANNTYCSSTSWQQINPDQVAEIFKSANSY